MKEKSDKRLKLGDLPDKYGYASSHRFRLRAFKTEAGGGKTYGSYSVAVKVTVPPAKVKKLSAEYWSRKKNGKYLRIKTI